MSQVSNCDIGQGSGAGQLLNVPLLNRAADLNRIIRSLVRL